MTALALPAPVRGRPELDGRDGRDGPDDEPTPVFATLGGLIEGRTLVVTEDRPLDEVRRVLVDFRVPAVVVVDADGGVRGLVTRTDVLRVTDPDARAHDAMSGFVFALPASASIERAAALMAYEGVGQIVVTSATGALLGMVSAVDLVRHLVRHLAIEAGRLG